MKVDRFFTPAEIEEVERAVGEAEKRTAGEIVPYAVDASDGYPGAMWTAAALGALAGPVAAVGVLALGDLWPGWLLGWVVLPPLAGTGLGWLAATLWPGLRRRLVPAAALDRRVEMRAAEAFVEQEVFATRDRTGILLFVSIFEHRVVVLADAGIHAKVDPAVWREVVDGVVTGIRAGRPGSALAAAVARCGEILAEHGVARRPGDVDELPDTLRRSEQ
jgi:putative membrane protein